MADETVVTPVATEAVATPAEATANTPAVAKNTDTQAEPMIPKSRFDEVNNRLKALEADSTKAAKAAKDAETKRLEEEGKYKELFEKQQAELTAAQAEARQASIKVMQRDVATKTNLPLALAERLRGETADEMEADAKNILAALPKPAAPNINASNGAGGAPAPGALDEAAKQRIADKYGVDARYI